MNLQPVNTEPSHRPPATGNPQPATDYPRYFRKAGTCRRVISPTAFNFITLPPESVVAMRASQEFKTPAELQSAMEGFTEVDATTWKDFYYTFLHSVAAERQPQTQTV